MKKKNHINKTQQQKQKQNKIKEKNEPKNKIKENTEKSVYMKLKIVKWKSP